MLRDFGLVTLIDLSVSLLGVLVALPAVLVLAERGRPGCGRPPAGGCGCRAARGCGRAAPRGRSKS